VHEHRGQVIKTLPHYRRVKCRWRSSSSSGRTIGKHILVAGKNVIKVHKMRRVCLSIFQSADGEHLTLTSGRADCDKCDKDMCKICFMCVIIAFYGPWGGGKTRKSTPVFPVTNAFHDVAADLSKCLPSVWIFFCLQRYFTNGRNSPLIISTSTP